MTIKPWLLASLFLACGNSFAANALTDSEPSTQPVLHISHNCDSLDPRRASHLDCLQLLTHLYENLATLDAQGAVAPGLAKQWQLLPKEKKIRFELHKNRYWSDGVPVTAQDFITAWSSILAQGISNHPQWRNLMKISGAKALVESKQGQLSGLTAITPHLLEVQFEQFDPLFHLRTVNGYLAPIPTHAYQQFGEAWLEQAKPPFNGWYIPKISDDGAIRLSLNAYHPESGELSIQHIRASQSNKISLKTAELRQQIGSGQQDYYRINDHADEIILAFLQTQGWRHESKPSADSQALVLNLNTLDPQLVDYIKCRFSSAEYISRSKSNYYVAAQRWVSLPALTLPELPSSIKPANCAEQQLSSLRLDQSAPRLTLMINQEHHQTSTQRHQVLKAQLARHGIDLQIEVKDKAQIKQRLKSGDFEAYAVSWYVALPDPSGFFAVLNHLGTHWLRPTTLEKVQRLTERANEQQGAERLNSFTQAEYSLLSEGGLIPLSHSANNYIISSRLCNFNVSQAALIPYRWLRWCDKPEEATTNEHSG